MRAVYRTVWIVSLLSIIGMSVWFLTQPPALPTVGAMVTYASDDKSLVFQYPGNWKPHESASAAVSARVAFDPNINTHFAIDTSFVGSLIGDIAKSGDPNLSALQGLPGVPVGAAEKEKSPLEMLHTSALNTMAKNKTRYPDFEHGTPLPTRIDGVEALTTDFTFKMGDIWGKQEMFGTYVTLLTKDREISVIATSSKPLQQTMKPLFDKMIASISLGPGGG